MHHQPSRPAQSWSRSVVLFSVAITFGCSHAEPPGELQATQQALTTPLEFRLGVPASGSLQNLLMVASSSLELGPRATLPARTDGTAATIANMGAHTTRIGPQATTGNVWSVGDVRLQPRARVAGNVRTQAAVTRGPGSVIDGAIEAAPPLSPAQPFRWTVQYEIGTDATVIAPRARAAVAPGAYRKLDVGPAATIDLRAGTYYVDDLQLGTASHVTADTTQGPVFIYVRNAATWSASDVAADPSKFFVGYAGQGALSIQSEFRGTLVAPSAEVRLKPSSRFFGSLFAASIDVGPNASATAEPFGAWEFLFPPRPVLDCVVHFDATHSTALWGYDNPLDVPVEIPVGPRNLLTPFDDRVITTFLPGRQTTAFSGFFATGSSTWQIGGGVPAAADAVTSPRCGPVALPPPPPPLDALQRSESASAPRIELLPRLQNQSVGVRSGALGPVTAQPPLAEGGFRFVIDNQLLSGSDAACGPLQLSVNVFVNGVGELRNFPGCTNPGACGVPLVYEVYDRTLAPGQTVVPIRIEVSERDTFLCGGDDDLILAADLTADAATGTILGGSLQTFDPASSTFLEPGTVRVESSGFGVDFFAEGASPPKVCSSWRAQYVDSGLQAGSASAEDYLVSAEPENVPASFTRAELIVRDGSTTRFEFRGLLDRDGCIPADRSPTRAQLTATPGLVVRMALQSEACWNPDGDCPVAGVGEVVAGARLRVALPPGLIAREDQQPPLSTRVQCAAITRSATAQEPDCEMQRSLGGWAADGRPPARIDIVNTSADEVDRVMGMVSHVLRQEDLGANLGIREALLERRGSTPTPGLITFAPNLVSCFPNPGIGIAPCGASEDLFACVARAACDTANETNVITLVPDRLGPAGERIVGDTYWKYTMAHELGHAVQERAMGGLSASYSVTAPAFAPPPKCACDHVTSSNTLHCLQSIEEPNAAHIEGWAQFYASRVWNDIAQPDCTFKYYKEFASDVCLPGMPADGCFTLPSGLISNKPPVPVSCIDPVRWRNTQCFDDTIGSGEAVTRWSTEYDYMGFLYSLDTQGGASRLTMNDLFDVFRAVCSGGVCAPFVATVAWDDCVGPNCQPGVAGLTGGADAAFGADSDQAAQFRRAGSAYGVSREVQ